MAASRSAGWQRRVDGSVTCGLTAVHRDQLTRAQRSVTSMGKLYLYLEDYREHVGQKFMIQLQIMVLGLRLNMF